MPFEEILSRLEKALPHANKQNDHISARGVDWHLEHSLKIINSICNTLIDSKPEDYTPKFSLAKYYILWSKSIPRGKGRSPKPFNNKGVVDTSKLPEYLTQAKERLNSIQDLHPKQHFRHPMFGDLELQHAKKFINIHTAHHLDIIEEIIAS